MRMQVTICGGGNAAHTLAGLLSSRKEYAVHMFIPFGDEAARWQEGIRETGGIQITIKTTQITGEPELITNEPEPAVSGSQIILLALPAFAHEPVLRQIAPYLSSGAWVGALPARGGFDLCVRDVFGKRTPEFVVFGLQTLPWACRIEEFGKKATILGTKEQVDLAAWPPEVAPVISDRLRESIRVPINPIPNFLCLTLADTGQLIHPGIMYGLFRDWDGRPYREPPLFYQGVDARSAETLEQMSAEIQNLRVTLEEKDPGLNLSAVRPLFTWLKRSYSADIADASSLQSSFVSNRSYTGLRAPMRKRESGLFPDFQARYLSEDVPYNLIATRGIAELAGVATPTIDRILSWAQDRLEKEYLVHGTLQGKDLPGTRCPQRYGYTSLHQFLSGMQYLPDGEGYDQVPQRDITT